MYKLVIIALVSLFISCSSVKKFQKKSIGLINSVSFKEAKFDNPNAANGFIVEKDHKTFAITAKHVLMIAKTDQMKFIDFEGQLKEWRMHPKNDSTKYVIAEELLNINRKDSLTWSYMNINWDTYNDWLVFSVKENKSKHKPLKIRTNELKKGEPLYVIGWSYKDSIDLQRVHEYKFDKTTGNFHNIIQVKGPKYLGGLSGSPIVDKKGKVVGLVSSGGEDEKTKQLFIQATDIKNVLKFISNLD